MADFAHLSKLKIDERTAEFPLPQVSQDAVLTVRPATQANRQFFNSRLKLSAKRSDVTSASTFNTLRNDDRELYAKFIVVSWKDVKDSHGADVPYSPDEALLLMKALPDWLFDKLRVFCVQSENFLASEDEPINAPETSKN